MNGSSWTRLGLLVLLLGAVATAGCGGKTIDSGKASSTTGGGDSTSATSKDATGCVEPTPPPSGDGGISQPPNLWIPESRYGTELAVPLDCYELNARNDCGSPTSEQRRSRVTATIRIEARDGVAHFLIDQLPSQGIGPGMSADDAVFDGNGTAQAGRAATVGGTDVSQVQVVRLENGRLRLSTRSQETEDARCGGTYTRKTECDGSIAWDGYTIPTACP